MVFDMLKVDKGSEKTSQQPFVLLKGNRTLLSGDKFS